MRTKLLLIGCWVLYAGLVIACASRHEPWFDEGQSWLLARDCSVTDLLLHRMRYEGTPALWQVVLMPFAKSGVPYTALNFISASFGILGVGLLFRRAPFPIWMRIGVAFSYIVLYQYAVVARSYSLILPILCGIAALYPRRFTASPVLYCVLVGLLANISLHTMLMAAVLVCEWLANGYRQNLGGRRRVLYWTCAGAFGLLYSGLFLQLLPPPDLVTVGTDPSKFAGLNRALSQVSEAFAGGLGSKSYGYISKALSCFSLAMFCFWFRKTIAITLFMGMIIPSLLIAGFVQSSPWHSGIIFLAWLFSCWIFLLSKRGDLAERKHMYWFIVAILIVQVFFGLNSIRFDILHTYSGSKALAKHLKDSGDERSSFYAVGFKAFAVQPYFDRNLFAAQDNGRTQAYYPWSKSGDRQKLNLDHVLLDSPERIILGIGLPQVRDMGTVVLKHGYCVESEFEGGIWWKNAIAEPDTYLLLRRC